MTAPRRAENAPGRARSFTAVVLGDSDNAQMGQFQRKYSHEQEAAIAFARNELRMTAPAVAEQAELGLLECDGEPLEPFTIPAATVRTIAIRVQRRAMGEAASDLLAIQHRDAVEILRQRMISAADHLSLDYQRQLRNPAKVDPERGRQIVRMIREAAALPARHEPAPLPVGSNLAGFRREGRTTGGLGAAILASHKRGSWPPEPATVAEPQPEPEPVDPAARYQAELQARIDAIDAREADAQKAPLRSEPPTAASSAAILREARQPGREARPSRRLADEDDSACAE